MLVFVVCCIFQNYFQWIKLPTADDRHRKPSNANDLHRSILSGECMFTITMILQKCPVTLGDTWPKCIIMQVHMVPGGIAEKASIEGTVRPSNVSRSSGRCVAVRKTRRHWCSFGRHNCKRKSSWEEKCHGLVGSLPTIASVAIQALCGIVSDFLHSAADI